MPESTSVGKVIQQRVLTTAVMKTQTSESTEQNEQLLTSAADGIELQAVDALTDVTLDAEEDDTTGTASAQSSKKFQSCGIDNNISISRDAHTGTDSAKFACTDTLITVKLNRPTSACLSGYIQGKVSKVQSWSITLVYFGVYFTMGMVIAAPGLVI